MSVENKEVPQLSLLDQLKLQRAQFNAQKDLAQTNLNQLVGAIFACDEMIKRHEEEAKNNMAVMDNSIVDSKEQEDGREMDSKGNQ